MQKILYWTETSLSHEELGKKIAQGINAQMGKHKNEWIPDEAVIASLAVSSFHHEGLFYGSVSMVINRVSSV